MLERRLLGHSVLGAVGSKPLATQTAESGMNIKSHSRSLAFGLVLLAVAFGFGGLPAHAQAIEPSSALPALEADGNADLAMSSDVFFCVNYYGADENCLSEAAPVSDVETASTAVDEVAPVVAELAPSATETDSPALSGTDAIKVTITESVSIAAPNPDVENREPESTGSLPSDAAAGEPNNAPDAATPARDGAD
jgi:hypothetical protein